MIGGIPQTIASKTDFLNFESKGVVSYYSTYIQWGQLGCKIGNIIGGSLVYEIPLNMYICYLKR